MAGRAQRPHAPRRLVLVALPAQSVGPPDVFRASEHPAVKAFLKDWLASNAAARAEG